MDAFIRVFDDARGYYGANKYVAKLERDLDSNGCLEQFKTEFERLANKPWSKGRAQAAFSGSKIDQAFTAATGNEARDIPRITRSNITPPSPTSPTTCATGCSGSRTTSVWCSGG